MKQRRLLFAPYLVPPTPRCGDCSWKAFTEEREGGERLEEILKKKQERSGLEKTGRDSSVWCSTLFSRRIMGLLRGCLPPMTVCLPVRMGTVSAWDWMPVLALWSGWSLHCGTASEWHRGGDVVRGRFLVFVVSLRMNASKKKKKKKGSVCAVWVCWLWRGVRGCLVELIC